MWGQAERSFFLEARSQITEQISREFSTSATIFWVEITIYHCPFQTQTLTWQIISKITSMIKLVTSTVHWCNTIKLLQRHMGWKYTSTKTTSFHRVQTNIMQWSQTTHHGQSNKMLWARPIPTSLLKKILPSVSQLLTAIVNRSTTLGTFPMLFKGALVWSLLKKANLDLVNKNYRPVLNLAFVGKLIKHVVADQVTSHIAQHNLMEANQSACHSYYSMETTLLKVKADILRAMDIQEVICLVLLDLSAAFDTVNHDTLITRLQDRFGIGGTALEWFKSYLSGR